ncbi:MAG: STAS domain-containing protein [Deltaproteobacteria bacterium]|nr:STAS domain-containing protein [Deltaproteobacteria bacterium]
MEVTKNSQGGVLVAAVKGRVDTVTASDFEKRIAEIMEGENSPLLLDCGGLEYISSAGLRSILVISKELKTKGLTVYFSGLQGNVKDVFNISGFNTIFKIFATNDDALKAF